MDPLTHSLLGAALAKTPPVRKIPLAAPTLILAANLPDVDVLSYFAGSDAGLGFRRGWTHGPLGLALLPLVLTAVIVLVSRRLSSRQRGAKAPAPAILLLAYLGALTHPVLDWLNTYGVRILMPFDHRWFYGDTLFIVDPWIWIVLGTAVFLGHAMTRRWVLGWSVAAALATAMIVVVLPADLTVAKVVWTGSLAAVALIAAHRGSRVRLERVAAPAALTLFLIYGLSMHGSSRLARRSVLRHLGMEATSVESVMVGPLPLTPFRKEVVIATESSYRLARFDWLARPRVELLEVSRPRNVESPVIDAARSSPCVRGFVGWARFPVFEVDESEAGFEVQLIDLRYSRERTRGFGGTSVQLDRDLQPRSSAGR